MKKRIEGWLRRIFAEEIAKLEGKLTEERAQVASYISIHTKSATNSIEVEVARLMGEFEAKVSADASKLLAEFEDKLSKEVAAVVAFKDKQLAEAHRDIAEAHEKLAKVTHWRADSATVQADISLQKVK